MAGKLSIRRVGNFLPSMCLAGGLLVIAVITYLSTVGLPDCALRYIEAEAARYGVRAHIDSICLAPKSGLAVKATNVRIELPQKEAAPATVDIRKALVSFNLSQLLVGDLRPNSVRVMGRELNLPYGEGEEDKLALKDIDLHTGFSRRSKGISITLKSKLQHVELDVRMLLNQPEKAIAELEGESTGEAEPADLDTQLKSIYPYLKKIKEELAAQSWNEHSHPCISLSVVQDNKWKIELDASVPSYEMESIHFRDAHLQASIKNRTFIIEKLNFRTIEPDTTVTLQGGYEWETRELEFTARSSAPIFRIISSCIDTPENGFLRKLHSKEEHTPTIELSGHASLAEDYALNDITLRGKLEHSLLTLGNTPIHDLQLSFFMRNGQFNIDTVQFKTNDGYIRASAQTADGRGQARINLSLSDETLLTLIREITDSNELTLPEGLAFDENLTAEIKGDMDVAAFMPGRSRLEDMIPTLRNLHLQFNTGKTTYQGTEIQSPALTLSVEDIKYNNEQISTEGVTVDALLGGASNTEQAAQAENLHLILQLDGALLETGTNKLSLQQAKLQCIANELDAHLIKLSKFNLTGDIASIETNLNDVAGSVRSGTISGALHADAITYGDTTANAIDLKCEVPEGIHLQETWSNMQKGTYLEASVQELHSKDNFRADKTTLLIRHIAENSADVHFNSEIGDKQLHLQSAVTLQGSDNIKLENLKLHLPAASLLPLLGGEPLQELKLPGIIDAEGSADICTTTGTVKNCSYKVTIPELIRVCQNVHVHKGMEIPLHLVVEGDFNTSADGSMQYAADLTATHQLGTLDIRVSGNPLKDCHITGSNTIPVSIINALIDNGDAHWIMRDFRCTPGVTRNVISNIDATIRYDKGIYVYTTCDAELYNMEFLLGAIRDKTDAQGNPTGEEYLRKDLSANPYSKVKEGRCGVEVIVQMDCVDDQGNPLPERLRINLNNPDLLYDNRPWLKRMGFKTGASTSRITGEAVRFNIENSTISLHKLRGVCYPAYSIGMYYAPIQHFMEDIILQDPVKVETDYCIFPLSRNCDVPMQGLIRATASTGAGFKFLGTTIPFTNFSGFINISDVDVYLDRMNAHCWGGVMDGSLRINFAGEHTSLDGYFVASNLNLKDIVASYGEDFTSATCNGYIRFQAPSPDLEAIQAYGQVHLQDGDLMQIGLFRPISSLLADMPGNLAKLQQTVALKKEETPPTWADKFIRYIFDSGSQAVDTVQDSAYKIPFANHFIRYGIDEAFSKFDITKGHLITRGMKAKGYNLNVGINLDIDLNTLTLHGDMWPKISSVPTVLISPITILSDFLIDINLNGDLLKPNWEFGLSKKMKGETPSLTPEPADKDN